MRKAAIDDRSMPVECTNEQLADEEPGVPKFWSGRAVRTDLRKKIVLGFVSISSYPIRRKETP